MAGEPLTRGVSESVRAAPAAPLRGLVSWYSGYRQAGVPPARHRGLPSPYLTLIITLDDPLTVAQHPDPADPPGEYLTLAGGLHTSPAVVTHPGRQSGIQLALSPLGARALLGCPAGALAGIDVDGSEVLGDAARELRERLGETGSWPARFALLDQILLDHADLDRQVSPDIAEAWRLLTRSGGTVRAGELARRVGWSPRYLQRRLQAETGLTPKAAARVTRFDRARRTLQRRAAAPAGLSPATVPAGLSLASLAAECGYYDQAHLAREFRELAGLPPVHVAGRGVPKRPIRPGHPGGRLLIMSDNNPPPQVWPTLRARDARALIRFLVDAFGFEETVVYGEGDRVDHAQLSWPPGGGVMLGSVRENHDEDSWPVPPGTFGAYVVTDDPDGLFARATAAGADVIQGLHETDYGSRDFAVRDPEGNRWSFGTYRGEPRKPA